MSDSSQNNVPAMRVIDKGSRLDRRGFLRGSGLGAIGVTVVPVTALAGPTTTSVEQAFPRLGAAAGHTLVRMARDISDGSQFTSSSAANPTLTIVALAIRQAEYIADAMQRREL